MNRIACVVRRGALEAASGVRTYVNTIQGLFSREGWSGKVIELGEAENEGGNDGVVTGSASKTDRSLQLAAGYLRTLFSEWVEARRNRSALGDSLILVNEFGCETLPVALRLAFPRARIVAIAHTHPGQNQAAQHWVRRLVEWMCLWAVSDVIFNSAALRREWERKLGASHIRGTVIYHGLPEPDLTIPDDYPTKPDGTVDFVCVARFVSWKGHRQLLQAWKRAKRQAEDGKGQAARGKGQEEGGTGEEGRKGEESRSLQEAALRSGSGQTKGTKAETEPESLSSAHRLILVGDGPELVRMQKLAEDLELTGSVIFLGGREEGARYFNGGDVGVLLSTEPEAFGLVLLEAMSRGKPVLASALGGIPEVVEDGVTGLLVEPGKTERVAIAILRLALDEKCRSQMGMAAHHRYCESFGVESMLASYERFLRADKV